MPGIELLDLSAQIRELRQLLDESRKSCSVAEHSLDDLRSAVLTLFCRNDCPVKAYLDKHECKSEGEPERAQEPPLTGS